MLLQKIRLILCRNINRAYLAFKKFGNIFSSIKHKRYESNADVTSFKFTIKVKVPLTHLYTGKYNPSQLHYNKSRLIVHPLIGESYSLGLVHLPLGQYRFDLHKGVSLLNRKLQQLSKY